MSECSNFEQTDKNREYWTLEKVQEVWDLVMGHHADNPEGIIIVMNVAKFLSPDDARRFWRGKRGRADKLTVGCASRSGAFELMAAGQLALMLIDLGLVKHSSTPAMGYLDVATGRRVTTRLRELARLGWMETEDGKAWLARNWPDLVAADLGGLKAWVRACNPRAKEPAKMRRQGQDL